MTEVVFVNFVSLAFELVNYRLHINRIPSDYGIKPPTAIFGRLKTGDEVKVNFELTVGAKAIAAALAGER